MKFLIVGRTGTGKDTVKELLMKKYGWRFVLSYTTRAKRSPDEDTHIFITHEDANAVPASDKVAVTHIKNGNDTDDEYFATRQQVMEADAYIIDPKGVATLLANMPEEAFEIVYITACDLETQKHMAIKRANGDLDAGRIFDSRYESEDAQFSAFENRLDNGGIQNMNNCTSAIRFVNDYTQDAIESFAFELNARKHLIDNMTEIVSDMIDNNMILVNEDKTFSISMNQNGIDVSTTLTMPQFVKLLLSDNEGFSRALKNWLSLSSVNISKSKED